MRHLRSLLSPLGLALALLAGCDAPSSDPRTGVRRFALDVTGSGFASDSTVAFDLSFWDTLACERYETRVTWRASAGRPATVDIPCVPGGRLIVPRLASVGVPAGAVPNHEVALPESVACPLSGQRPPVRLDVRLGGRGFLDVYVAIDHPLHDAWLLRIEDETLAGGSWTPELTAQRYGDGVRAFSYVTRCGLGSTGEVEPTTVTLVPSTPETRREAAPVPEPQAVCEQGWSSGIQINDPALPLVGLPDPLLVWPPPPLTRAVGCVIDADTLVSLGPIAVAAASYEALETRAVFGGVSCGAAWRCGDAARGRALELSCTPDPAQWSVRPDRPAPVMHFDDLVLTCPGAPAQRLDPTVGADLARSDVGGRPVVTWTVRPALDPALVATGGCALTARATAAVGGGEGVFDDLAADGVVPAGAVWPLVRWQVAVGGADGAGCAPAALKPGGAVDVIYTALEATEATVLPHASE